MHLVRHQNRTSDRGSAWERQSLGGDRIGSTLNGADGPQSIPALLHRNATQFAGSAAYREKESGHLAKLDLGAGRDEIEALALGLLDLGVNEGDFVAIIGRNRPYLYWAMVAAQMCRRDAGAAVSGRGRRRDGLCAGPLRRALCDCRRSGAGRQSSRGAGQLHEFEQMIYLDPRGLRKYDHTTARSIAMFRTRAAPRRRA